MGDIVKTSYSRVFTIEDRAGPAHVPIYQGQAKAGAPSADFGDVTVIRNPDPNVYGRFKPVGTIRGEPGSPTLPLVVRYQYTLSEFLRMGIRGCPLDVQLHLGKCQDPRDFNRGYDKVLVLEGGLITGWNPDDMGALEQGEEAVVNESIDIPGLKIYEVVPLSLAELGVSEVAGEVMDVAICDSIQCGECGLPSTGCQVVFGITETQYGSPGLPGEVFYSQDGGITIGETIIDTLDLDEDPSAVACVGTRLVVVSNDDCAIHYALIADILTLETGETWVRTAVNLVCPAGAPNDLFSLGSAHTWIVGDGGYIYFSDDITAGVVVQDAGVACGNNALSAVHAYDEDNVLVAGAAGAMAVTRNGGATWANVDTTPIGAVEITCVWMRSRDVWFAGTIQGNLYYTRDGGITWTLKPFPGSAAGAVRDIVFSTDSVGYLAHDTDAIAGRILRTIDGGFSWYVLPEGAGAIPANDRINALAAVAECPNVVYGGGLSDEPPDGFFVKGAAAA